MNGAFDRITPVIYRYEGTIARLLGDALWAFLGEIHRFVGTAPHFDDLTLVVILRQILSS
jgi:hypothetical protein